MLNRSMYLILIFVIAILGLAVIRIGKNAASAYKEAEIVIGDNKFYLDIADTINKRQRGLGGRDSLSENGGMLFLFDGYSKRRIWMRGMEIPIDIVWVRDGRVVGFNKNVQPQPGVATIKLDVYTSPESVDKILELRAGSVDKYGINNNDSVKINFKE
ncbi:MAG: hypothetical protein COT88_00965 [Candidatus Colwellbacteria bacterium CG10_big_fil_rev_8_21_14_0_10_41_28]|uniref:DUF192 domain-containing protein n=1 Tax=Candidatus Colwellbacteria bacterium CG10_big_fil_rev_8_21_14_0_10_41_28 TaxID=1974539 RepID=A0A2H0VJK0_9BACT|nr:MAG: hypothetical protein COT88_00965 [Candidatus Colwellbacteria bacterium CG10_big_fil_rev_8_21_14_0_10_41_28]